MTRADFKELDFATMAVGQRFTLGTHNCRFKEYTSYVWGLRQPVPKGSMEEYTQHPRRKGPNRVLLLFDRTIAYDLADIPVRLSITSYYAGGPSGFYVEVDGSIGDTAVRASAALTGSFRKRDTIEPIVVDNFIFYITFSIDSFSLAFLQIFADK